jgi:hypothetical protein
MQHKQLNSKAVKPAPTLAQQSTAALQQLARLSQSLLQISERESQALLLNDILAFSILQYEKEKLVHDYAQASAEFRNRLTEFRKSDPGLLSRLEKLQKDLAASTKANNLHVEQIKQRAEAQTQKSLQVIKNFAQKAYVRFEKTETQTATQGV